MLNRGGGGSCEKIVTLVMINYNLYLNIFTILLLLSLFQSFHHFTIILLVSIYYFIKEVLSYNNRTTPLTVVNSKIIMLIIISPKQDLGVKLINKLLL